MYLVRLNDRLWLRHADLDGPREEILGTDDPEKAARFPTALDAVAQIARVPTHQPLFDYKLRRPLLDGGAQVQELDDARAEARRMEES